jgi:sugar lactone lactonase YvrE
MTKEYQTEVWLTELGQEDLSCPFISENGVLHVITSGSGEVHEISKNGQMRKVHGTGGQLSGAVFQNSVLYMADFAHGAVVSNEGGDQELVVGVYEDRPLKGPNSIIREGDTIFFTDSGPLGETGLHNPSGSLFTITGKPSEQVLKPLSYNNLAYPTGVAYYKGMLYVAEMMTNRILRFYQEPEGVFHGSVFYQNSGGVGPSSVAVDEEGTLYVGVFESSAAKSTGKVLILNKDGGLEGTVVTDGAEVSGVVVHGRELIITERSTGSIQKVAL